MKTLTLVKLRLVTEKAVNTTGLTTNEELKTEKQKKNTKREQKKFHHKQKKNLSGCVSKSRRFQPYPSTNKTRLETLWTGVKECRKRIVRETTKVTLLLSLASILLVYYWLLINL